MRGTLLEIQNAFEVLSDGLVDFLAMRERFDFQLSHGMNVTGGKFLHQANRKPCALLIGNRFVHKILLS